MQEFRKADLIPVRVVASKHDVPHRLFGWHSLRGSCRWFFLWSRAATTARFSPDGSLTSFFPATMVLVYGRTGMLAVVPCRALWLRVGPHAADVEGDTAKCTFSALAFICVAVIKTLRYHGVCQISVIPVLDHEYELDTSW